MRWIHLAPALMLALSACDMEPEDYPGILAVDAFCAAESPDWFDLWAEVDHDRGYRAVSAVWVDVSFVEYDSDDTVYLTYVTSFDLDYIADGQWAAAVQNGTSSLACDYPFEFHFLFTAEDDGGQKAYAELIN